MNAKLDVIGPERANCAACELQAHCVARRWVPARRPTKPFNGIMFVGEGPGPTEVSRQIPMQGRPGRLLEVLLGHANVDPEASWFTYAVLGSAPLGQRDDAGFMDQFPAAVHSCVSRLRAEVELARPRVIVTLGETAMVALAGHEVQKTRNVPVACAACDAKDRKVGPVLACAVGTCDWWHALDPVLAQRLGRGDPMGLLVTGPAADDAEEAAKLVKLVHGEKCPKCEASIKRLRPKRAACPLCGGRKTCPENFLTFEHTHKFKESAGGLFAATRLPGDWAALGVEWLVATYDPSFCLRATSSSEGRKFGGQFAARAMIDHLAKAARFAAGHTPRFRLEPSIIDSAEDLDDYLARHGAGLYIVDIETDSEEGPFGVNEIKCVGIRRAGQAETIVVDTRGIPSAVRMPELGLQPDHTRLLAECLFRFLRSGRAVVGKVLQNGHYDRVTIEWFWGIHVEGQEGDTMLAHQDLYPDEPHDLAHLGATLTDCEAWKPPKKHSGELKFESFEDLCVYNARDLAVTDLASEAMGADSRSTFGVVEADLLGAPDVNADTRFGRLREEKVDRAYEQDMQLLDLAVAMTVNGMPVDIEARASVLKECTDATSLALEQMEHELRSRRVGEARLAAFAPTKCRECAKLAEACKCSPDKQRIATAPAKSELAWVLFDPAGPFRFTPTVLTEKTKEPSTSKEALLKLADEPFVQAVLEHAKFEKWRSTFIEGSEMKIQRDGRIHPGWRVGGARTGRFSSSPNFQNFPKHLRGVFRARKGRKIVGADFDQLELRASAALSGDADLIRRCMEADASRKLYPESDPHSYVASHVFGEVFTSLDPEDPKHRKFVPGEPACKCQKCRRTLLRDVTKRVIYGLNYGAGAPTVLAAIYDGGYEGPPITLQTIERAIKVYFGLFPGIPKWRDGQLRLAAETYEVRSLLQGRRRTFPLGEVDSTVVFNFPIQSTSADIVNERTIIVCDALASVDPSAIFIAQVHDALYFETAEDRAQAVADLIDEKLPCEHALAPGAPKMYFGAGAQIADSWKEAA